MAVQGALRAGAGRRVRRGDARGRASRGGARRHGRPRQGRLARRDRSLAAARAAGQPPASCLAVDAGRPARRSPRARPAQRRRLASPAAWLPEGVHGRDARLADRVDGRRKRRLDHERRGARGDRARGSRGRLARRRARDRRRGEPGGARRLRALARRVAAAGPPSANRACAVPRPRGRRTLRRARRRRVRPVLARPLRRGARRSATGPTGSTARTRSARCSTPAPCSRTAPTRRSRSSSRGRVSSPPSSTTGASDQRLTLEQALHAICVAPAWLSHDERVRGTLVPGRYADLVVLDRDPFALRARGAARGAGRRDDARRPLDPQPTSLGLIRPDRVAIEDRAYRVPTRGGTMEAAPASGGRFEHLREHSIGLPQVLFQSITHMAPAAAVAYSIFISVPAGAAGASAFGRPRTDRVHLRRDCDRTAREAVSVRGRHVHVRRQGRSAPGPASSSPGSSSSSSRSWRRSSTSSSAGR